MRKIILLLLLFPCLVKAQQTYSTTSPSGTSPTTPTFRYFGTDSLRNLWAFYNGAYNLLYSAAQQNGRFLLKINPIVTSGGIRVNSNSPTDSVGLYMPFESDYGKLFMSRINGVADRSRFNIIVGDNIGSSLGDEVMIGADTASTGGVTKKIIPLLRIKKDSLVGYSSVSSFNKLLQNGNQVLDVTNIETTLAPDGKLPTGAAVTAGLAGKARTDSTFNINKNLYDVINKFAVRDNLGLTYANSTDVIFRYIFDTWGDSLTAGLVGNQNPYPTQLTAATGYPNFNGGTGGQTSTQIAVRQGGVSTTVTVTGGTIPASGGVTITFPTGFEPVTSQTVTPVYGTIAGVYGQVTLVSTTYTFTRVTAGSSVSASGSQPFTVDEMNHNKGMVIIWAGRNDPAAGISQATTLANIAAMVAHLGHTRYIILGVINSSTEPTGSGALTAILSLNTALSSAYGTHYIDAYAVLRAHGDGSTNDNNDIANGLIPRSLQYDGLHLVSLGYYWIANAINQTAPLALLTGTNASVLTPSNLKDMYANPFDIGTVTPRLGYFSGLGIGATYPLTYTAQVTDNSIQKSQIGITSAVGNNAITGIDFLTPYQGTAHTGAINSSFYGVTLANGGLVQGMTFTSPRDNNASPYGFRFNSNGGITYQFFDTNTGYAGFNTTTPRKRVDILDASGTQLRLSYSDNTQYADLGVNNVGKLYVNPIGLMTGFGTQTPNAVVDAQTAITNISGNVLNIGHTTGNIKWQFQNAGNSGGNSTMMNLYGYNSGGSIAVQFSPLTTSFINSGSSFGIGTSTPRRRLDVLDAGGNAQIRATYTDNSVYTDFLTTSSGNLNILPSNRMVAIGNSSPQNTFTVTAQTTGLGTVTVTASGTTVTGIGTQFQNTFSVGQTITANSETHTITAIASNTSMTTDAWTSAATSVAYTLVGGTRFTVSDNGFTGVGYVGDQSTGAKFGVNGKAFVNGDFTIGLPTSGTTPNLKYVAATSGTLTETVPSTVISYTLTKPSAAPTVNGQVMSYTTAGVGSWVNQGAYLLTSFYTDVANSGTSTSDVYSYTTAANTFTNTGSVLEGDYTGRVAIEVSSAMQISIYFAGQQVYFTPIFNSPTSVGGFHISFKIIRTGASTARIVANFSSTASGVSNVQQPVTDITGVNFATTNILKATVVGAASNDLTFNTGYYKINP